jgi:hypothetical protein
MARPETTDPYDNGERTHPERASPSIPGDGGAGGGEAFIDPKRSMGGARDSTGTGTAEHAVQRRAAPDGGAGGGEAFEDPSLDRRQPSVDDLSAAARAPDREGLTVAGRSLTKHAVGQRAESSEFPRLQGGPDEINDAAHAQVDGILRDPATLRTTGYRGRFGDTIEFDAPDGRGLVYDRDGNFLFFKETPR